MNWKAFFDTLFIGCGIVAGVTLLLMFTGFITLKFGETWGIVTFIGTPIVFCAFIVGRALKEDE